MKTNVRQSSIDAFRALDMPGRQAEVMAALEDLGCRATLNEIAAHIGVAASSCTGAVNELRKGEWLHYGPRRPCRITGNNNHEIRMGAEPQEDPPPLIRAIQTSLLEVRR